MKTGKNYILLILVTLLGGWQMLRMFFRDDDFALMFKLQHPFGNSGIIGPGILGAGMYRYFDVPFLPFYNIFKLNPAGYYLVGLLIYLLGVFSAYQFFKLISKNNFISLLAGAILATGYIGAETNLRIFTTYHGVGLILTGLSFAALFKFLLSEKRQFKYYVFSLGLFFLALECDWLRAHGLIFSLLSAFILFGPFWKIPKSAFLGLILQLPFFWLFYNYYINGVAQTDRLSGLLKNIFLNGQYDLISALMVDLGHLSFPDPLSVVILDHLTALSYRLNIPNQFFLHVTFFIVFLLLIALLNIKVKRSSILINAISLLFALATISLNFFSISKSPYWFTNPADRLAGIIGGMFISLVLWFILSFWKSNRHLSKILIFSLIWTLTNFLAPFLDNPVTTMETVHRYFIYSAIGYSLLLSATVFLLATNKNISKTSLNQKLYLTVASSLVLLFLALVNIHQNQLINKYSIPAKNFYKIFTSQVRSLDKGSILYFSYKKDAMFGNIFPAFFSVSSMPVQTSVAIFYNMDRDDLRMADTYNELLYRIKSGKVKVNNSHIFYYDYSKLTDSSPWFKNVITNGDPGKDLEVNWNSNVDLIQGNDSVKAATVIRSNFYGETLGVNPLLEADIKNQAGSSTPMILTFKLKVAPLNISAFTYHDLSHQASSDALKYLESMAKIQFPKSSTNLSQKFLSLKYQLSKIQFSKLAKIQTTSEFKYAEAVYIDDGRLDTAWSADRSNFHFNQLEDILIDLQQSKNLAGLVTINHHPLTTMTDYDIFYSDDKQNWKLIKNVSLSERRDFGQRVVDLFPENIDTRYLKLSIHKTFNSDAPSLDEIWTLDSDFRNLDINEADKYFANPYQQLENNQEYDSVLNLMQNLSTIKVSWQTDEKDSWSPENFTILPINIDGNLHEYELIIPPSGLLIKKVRFDQINNPGQVEISKLHIRYPNLEELDKRGFIHPILDN